MKKLTVFFLAASLALTMAACGSGAAAESSSAEHSEETKEKSETGSRDEKSAESEVEEEDSEEELAPEISEENAPEDKAERGENVAIDDDFYDYEAMLADLDRICQEYPEYAESESLGTTADGRELFLCRLGDENSSQKIFVNAGIHAREYITSQLAMRQMEDFLAAWSSDENYKGYSLKELMQDTAIYVMPMVNPDGIAISQKGIKGVQSEAVVEKLKKIAEDDEADPKDREYFRLWKANGLGVDLNRNFNSLWETFEGAEHNSSERYKGTAPGSEIESKAMIELTNRELFDRTISYHASGSVVYWYFAQPEPVFTATMRYAQRLWELTGYPMDSQYEHLDPAGYKDWCLYEKQIPSVTIEVGRGNAPVDPAQFDTIVAENRYVLQETLLDLLENPYDGSDPKSNRTNVQAGDELYVAYCNRNITLRKAPDTKAEKITSIWKGEKVTYKKTTNNYFYQIDYKGKTGYVMAQYLGLTEPEPLVTSEYLTVINCSESITLREKADTKAAEVCQIPLGEEVRFLELASDGFFKIEYDGRTGYALADYLE